MSPRFCFLLAGTALGVVLCLGAAPAARVRGLVLSGAAAPGGLTFASFGRAATNGRGSVCFLAGWDGVNRRREGLYLRTGGGVTPIARAGDPVPGSAGGRRISFPPGYADEFSSFCLNERDEVAYIVRQGLFLFSEGQSRAVALVGEAVPGVEGVRWDEILAISLNDTGQIAFVAATRSVLDGERLEGLFLVGPDAPEIVLHAGDALPELPGELMSFSGVALNDRGEIACLARVGEEEQDAILLLSGTDTRVVALQEAEAPGGLWAELGSVALNDRGEIAFQGRVADAQGEQTGIYRTSGEAVRVVAVPGQSVAGGAGERLGEFLARPALDEDGTIAFVAELDGEESPQVLVLAGGDGRLVVMEREASGVVRRFAGLNQGSLHGGRVVCAVSHAGQGDRVVRFGPGQPAEVVVAAGALLPAGSALLTVDDETGPRETQARMAGEGAVVFAAEIGGYGRALFRMAAGGPELLTPLGQPAEAEAPLRSVIRFSVNEAGRVAFLGYRDEEGSDAAIYKMGPELGAMPRVLFRTGQAVPGASGQVVARLGSPQITRDGSVFFTAEAVTPREEPGLSAPELYLLAARDGQVEILAAEGMRIEGVGTLKGHPLTLAEGTLSTVFRDVQANEQALVLFSSSFQEEGTDVFVPSGLFLLESSSVRSVARIGQTTPLGDGSTYNGFSSPRLGENGAISFLASVVGAGRRTRTGLFRVVGGVTSAVAVTGDQAPGADGALYRALLDPHAGASGETAYLALLAGTAEVRGRGALYATSGATAQLRLGGAQAEEETGLRLDDGAAPVPLALLADRRLLLAGRASGEGGPAGLFLLEP